MLSERDFELAVAWRLRVLRKALQMSQEALGKRLRVGGTAVSNYEAAVRAVAPYHAFMLKQFYDIPLEWLYTGNERVLTEDLKHDLVRAEEQLTAEDAALQQRKARRA